MSSSKKTMLEFQTEVDFISKRIQSTSMQDTCINQKISLNEGEVKYSSLTEKQLLSRDLIQQIMLKGIACLYRGKAKTIIHQIGKIENHTCLYAKPITCVHNKSSFDNILSGNNYNQSIRSTKINQICKGLKTRPVTVCKKDQRNRHSFKSESRTKKQQIDFRSQRVAVSGLVTYKFSSVNAQRSLALNKLNHEEKLQKEIKKASQFRDCHSNRFKKILLKQSNKKYKNQSRKQRNILQNLMINTDLFLQEIDEDNQREMLVYGEKAKKMCFIKQYMALENTNYEEGRHIIDQIQRCKTQSKKNQEFRRVKTQNSEEVAFESRRVPRFNKNIKIKHFTFVE